MDAPPADRPAFPDGGHEHQGCVADALARAEDVCRQRGARLTPLRRRVLELVWDSHRAVKAYDLLAALGETAGAAKPPTVYRTLEFLMEHGLVHRIDSLNAFVGCPQPRRGPQRPVPDLRRLRRGLGDERGQHRPRRG